MCALGSDGGQAPLGFADRRRSLLALSAVEKNEYPRARTVFDELRGASYVTNAGKRGIELDNAQFGALADVLYHECDWEPFQIRSRLKHYEGWGRHEWA